MKLKHFIGKLLLKSGFKYGVSTDIAGFISFGYGKLDSYGFWQFPIYKKDLKNLIKE